MILKRQYGFTLIELMIAVAIVAILAAVAWPSYQNQIRSSKRADAKGALMGLAQAMERHFTDKGTYKGAATGGADDGAPAIYPTQSPIDGSNKSYNLSITVPEPGTSYTLEAVPITGTAQVGDGNLRLNSAGQKAWDRGNDGSYDDSSDMCWDRVCS